MKSPPPRTRNSSSVTKKIYKSAIVVDFLCSFTDAGELSRTHTLVAVFTMSFDNVVVMNYLKTIYGAFVGEH